MVVAEIRYSGPAGRPAPSGRPGRRDRCNRGYSRSSTAHSPDRHRSPVRPICRKRNVLVSSYDAQGNPVTEWTGRGTANPQAGEIAGANPGLVQLAQYMGMTPAQTQAWIQTSQAKTGVTPPVLPS